MNLFKLKSVFRENLYLAVGTDDGEVYIWRMETLSLFKKYQVLSAKVRAISYGSDDQKLAVGGDDKLFQVIDFNTGMAVFTSTLKSFVSCLKWRSSLLVLGCDNGSVLVWDMFAVRLLYDLELHSGIK